MKRILNQRPVAFAAFFLIAGIAAAYYAGLPAFFALPAFIGSAAVFAGMLLLRKKQVFAFFYLCIFFLGAFLFQAQFHTDFPPLEPNRPQKVGGVILDRAKMGSETHLIQYRTSRSTGGNLGKKQSCIRGTY